MHQSSSIRVTEVVEIGTFGNRDREILKPKIPVGRDQVCAEAVAGEKGGPVNWVFNRDSSEESKEPLPFKGEVRMIC